MSDDDDAIQPTSAYDTSCLEDDESESEADVADVLDLQSSWHQPDEDRPEPDSTLQLIRNNAFKTHENVEVDISRTKSDYALRARFNDTAMYRISRSYTTAVYDHAEHGTAVQSRQVFAILFHNLDHQWATVAQREHYHHFCGTWCGFRRHVDVDRKLPETYSKTTTSFMGHSRVKWERGIFAGIDTLYPNAFIELVGKFRTLASQTIMQRCSHNVTTNMNESMHARYHKLVSKSKPHGLTRIMFAAQQVLLTSNFGQQRSNLGNVFGTKSVVAGHDLDILQSASHHSAERFHKPDTNRSGTRLKGSNKNPGFVSDRKDLASKGQCETAYPKKGGMGD